MEAIEPAPRGAPPAAAVSASPPAAPPAPPPRVDPVTSATVATMDEATALSTFMAVSGADETTSRAWLESTNWNLEAAVDNFMHGLPMPAPPMLTSSAVVDDSGGGVRMIPFSQMQGGMQVSVRDNRRVMSIRSPVGASAIFAAASALRPPIPGCCWHHRAPPTSRWTPLGGVRSNGSQPPD